MKILVIQTGKLGDMVCTTPVFRAIKNQYPDARLVVAGASLNGQVLKGNPYIDAYWDFRRMSAVGVREERFDVALLMTPNPAMLRMLQKGRVRRVIVPKVVGGYSPLMTKRYRFWSMFATNVPHRMGHYAPQEYLNMLRPLNIESNDSRKELYVDASSQKATGVRLAPFAGMLKVAIAPAAGNKIKEWPPEHFSAVAKHLIEKHKTLIILIGGSADRLLAAIVKKGLPETNVLDTTGELSIEELKGLVSHIDLFISADTGPLYIAEAFEVPTIDIVGPVDEREQPPIAPPRHVVLAPERMRPELFVMNARTFDAAEARRQAEGVDSEQVIAVVDEMLGRM